jgi:hypothetical protein
MVGTVSWRRCKESGKKKETGKVHEEASTNPTFVTGTDDP